MNFHEHGRFPVVILYDDGDMSADETSHMLTVCRRLDIKAGPRGRFAAATIVDSAGLGWRMSGAEIIEPLGIFRRIGLLFGQSMRVRPKIVVEAEAVDLASFKGTVIERLKKRDGVSILLKIAGGLHGCATLERKVTFGLIPRVELATCAADVIAILLSAEFPERQRWLET